MTHRALRALGDSMMEADLLESESVMIPRDLAEQLSDLLNFVHDAAVIQGHPTRNTIIYRMKDEDVRQHLLAYSRSL